MRKELLAYAAYTFLYKLPMTSNGTVRKATPLPRSYLNRSKDNLSILFSYRPLGILVCVLLAIVSLLLLKTMPFLWGVLLAVFIAMILYSKKETEPYGRAILIDGTVSIFAALLFSYIMVCPGNEETEPVNPLLLILVAIVYLLAYEIVVLIKIIMRKYSQKKQKAASQDSKNVDVWQISFSALLGSTAGIALSKLLSIFIPSSTSRVIITAFIGLLWLCGFVLLQKYLLLKLLKRK